MLMLTVVVQTRGKFCEEGWNKNVTANAWIGPKMIKLSNGEIIRSFFISTEPFFVLKQKNRTTLGDFYAVGSSAFHLTGSVTFCPYLTVGIAFCSFIVITPYISNLKVNEHLE